MQNVSIQVKICSYGHFIRCNTTVTFENDSFAKPEIPNTWGYLCMIIGLFGFYSHLFSLYELDVWPWIDILSERAWPGKLCQKEDMEMIKKFCISEYQRFMERLKEDFFGKYFSKTITILKVSYKYILVQGQHEMSVYAILWLLVGNKFIVTIEGWM